MSLIFPEDCSPHLRGPEVLEQYRKASLEHGVQICSHAIGSPGKRRLPLLPILGESHIHMDNPKEVDTFVAMMEEVGRYAEKAGVVIALEASTTTRATSR